MNGTINITFRQKSIIVGKILGDGCLETANGRTYRLKIEHAESQKEYIDWQYQELKSLLNSLPKEKSQLVKGKMYKKYWFQTPYTSSLRFYAHLFYPRGKKVVPKFIHKWLTPLTLAVWFMDDGSVKSKECQGKYLNTQGFDALSVKRLQGALKHNFSIITSLRKQKEGTQIYIPAAEVEKLRDIAGKYIIPSMRYKLD